MSSLTVNQALGQIKWFTPQQLDDAKTEWHVQEVLAEQRRHGRKSKPATTKKDRTP